MSNEADISKLRIVVESKTDGIVDKLTSLASALETLKSASKGSFKGLENCAKAIANLADAVSKINDEDIDRLERMANAVQKMSGVKFSSSFVRAMGSMSGSTKGGAMTVGSKFSSGRGWTWNDNGSGSGSAVFLGGGGGGSGGGYPPIDIGGLFGSGRRGGSFSIPAIFTKFKAKMSGFLGSILRIAMYRLIRRALMLIVNAFKEGLKNAKEWSRINNTQLYESMKRLSAAGLAMKNALGAALGELIISIRPALEWLALKIADIGNSLANMFASLRRSDTYQKAITDLNKLAEAQERYNRALLGFDEIHKLSAQENISDYFTMEETDKTQAGYSVAKIAGIATLAIALKALLSNGSIGALFGKVASWFGGGAAAASPSSMTPFLQSVFGGGSAAGAAGGGALGTLTLAAPWLAVIGAVAAVGIGSMVWMKSHRAEVQAFADSLVSKYTMGNNLTSRELSTAEIIRYNMEHPNYQLPLTDPRLTGPAILDAMQDYRDLVYQTQHPREAAEDAVLKIIVENPNGQTLTQTEMYYNDILNGRVGQVKVPGSPYIGR